MWVLYAFGSALFAGITAVLAKIGIKGVNSHLATALPVSYTHLTLPTIA